MSVDVRGLTEVGNLFQSLGEWINRGSRKDVDKGVKDLAEDFKEKMLRGQGADGLPLAPLKKSTLEGPVRVEGRPEIRNTSYGDVPLNASGRTANSITGKKVGLDEWEISSSTDIGDKILHSNANTTHHGNAFGGDTPKVIRDPVQVTEKQMDIMEKSLLDGIDRALNG